MKWPDQTAISVTFDGWHWRHAPYVEDVAQPGDEISPHLGDEADSACPARQLGDEDTVSLRALVHAF